MCMVQTPKTPAMPPERAAMKFPDLGAIRDAISRRTMDRIQGAPSTILTSGQGVMQNAPTLKKMLLGA